MSAEPVTLINSVLPLGALAAMAIAFPEVLAGRHSLSQRRLAFAVAASAVLILGMGALILAALYARAGAQVGGAASGNPLATVAYFLRASVGAVPFWAPLLLLVWLIKAQAVETRRGKLLARMDRGARP